MLKTESFPTKIPEPLSEQEIHLSTKECVTKTQFGEAGVSCCNSIMQALVCCNLCASCCNNWCACCLNTETVLGRR